MDENRYRSPEDSDESLLIPRRSWVTEAGVPIVIGTIAGLLIVATLICC